MMPVMVKRSELFDRRELSDLKYRALALSETAQMAGTWKRAYVALVDALDRLDAMTARSTECACGREDGWAVEGE